MHQVIAKNPVGAGDFCMHPAYLLVDPRSFRRGNQIQITRHCRRRAESLPPASFREINTKLGVTQNPIFLFEVPRNGQQFSVFYKDKRRQ